MRMRIGWVLWFLLLSVGGATQAAEPPERFNQISFQVRAAESVANDRMQVVLAVQGEDENAAVLADRLNKTMAWALAQARAQSGVEVRSGGYATQPVYRKEALVGWRAAQELVLQGGDFAQLGALIGTLQERLQLRSVAFSVAPQTRAEVERRLIDRALEDFKRRADQVRANLGSKTYRIVEASIQTEDQPVHPMPIVRAQAMSESVAPPAFEGGDSEIRVGVHGVIQLE